MGMAASGWELFDSSDDEADAPVPAPEATALALLEAGAHLELATSVLLSDGVQTADLLSLRRVSRFWRGAASGNPLWAPRLARRLSSAS